MWNCWVSTHPPSHPPHPLTENHLAQKSLVELRGTPPFPLMEKIRSVVFDGLPKIFFLFKENRFVVKTKKIERWYVEATPLWVGVLTRASFQQRRMSLHSAAERVKYE